MLIGRTTRKTNVEKVRKLKRVLREGFQIPNDTILMISELACLEDGCAPRETVFGLLPSGKAQQQCKRHKSIQEISCEDLILVGEIWGCEAQKTDFESIFISIIGD